MTENTAPKGKAALIAAAVVSRPRFSISILRGLLDMNGLASAELANFSPDEQREVLHGSDRDYHRAAEWLIKMSHWYMSKGEQP